MSEVNESIFEFRDGVFIGGNNPPPHFKPMTNNELTLDQLTAITGGVVMRPDGETCTDHFEKVPERKMTMPTVERLGPDWWYDGEEALNRPEKLSKPRF